MPYRGLVIGGGSSKPVLENGSGSEESKGRDRANSGSEDGESPSKVPTAESIMASHNLPSSKSPQDGQLSRSPSDVHSEGSQLHGRPTRSKSSPFLGSKLVAPSQRAKEKEGEAPSGSTANEPEERPPSRLRIPSSGRSTPLSQTGRSTPSGIPGKSGIARPSSRLAKTSQVAEKSPTAEQNGELGGSGEAEEKIGRRDSRLRLQRKNSDGATKRHRVLTAGAVSLETGTSSLPRNLPKGILTSGLMAPGSYRKHGAASESKTNDFEAAGDYTHNVNVKGDSVLVNESKGTSEELDKGTEGGRRMLKAPAKFASGIRTPNLPSGPQASLTREERNEAPSSAGAPTLKLHKLQPPERKIPAPHPAIQRPSLPSGSGALPKHKDILTTSSNSSLESCTSGEIKLANSASIDRSAPSSEVRTVLSEKKPAVSPSLQLSGERGGQGFVKGGEILSPPTGFKQLGEQSETSPKRDISRYSRRISPEGMSHEDQGSPREGDQKLGNKEAEENLKNERELGRQKEQLLISQSLKSDHEVDKQKKTKVVDSDVINASEVSNSAASEADNGTEKSGISARGTGDSPPSQLAVSHGSQPETGQPYSESMSQLSPQTNQKSSRKLQAPANVKTQNRHRQGDIEEDRNTKFDVQHNRSSRLEEMAKSPDRVKRARSLSPKSSHRVNLHVPVSSGARKHFFRSELDRTASNDSAKSENQIPSPTRKSCLRNGTKSRTSSSSSLESARSTPKVTISPRSSQLVYDPEETGLHPPPTYAVTAFVSPKHLSPDRPQSFTESIISSSDSSSPPGSMLAIAGYPRTKVDVVRRASTLSTTSERLDYHEVASFLRPSLEEAEHSKFGSTPEVCYVCELLHVCVACNGEMKWREVAN